MNNNYDGEIFLLKLYKDALKNSDKVKHGKYSEDAIKNVKKYMDRLESTHKHALDNNRMNLLKKFYYNMYVIKEEDINPASLNGKTIEDVIEKQKSSLDSWIEYLVSPYSNYPTWAKYWAFQGMLKMGTYDSDKKIFNRRTKNTSKPFIDCNPEVLSHAIELIIKYNHNQELDDEKVEKLVSSGSFSKIYGTLYLEEEKKKREQSFTTEGIWIKYNQGSEEEAHKLFDSLQGYSTEWCTAGSYSTAKSQICGPYNDAPNGGDFYVYYTKDEQGEYKVPRIAIRMSGKIEIAEIRGILENQCLESGLEYIVREKLDNIENLSEASKTKAINTCEELKILSIIVNKTHNNEELTKEEVLLLYGGKTIGFGWKQDPRVEETKQKRINKSFVEKDLSLLSKNEAVSVIQSNINLLRYLSTNINDYKEIVNEVVKQNIAALKYVPTKIKDYDEIVLEALKQNEWALTYLSTCVEDSKEIMIKVVKKDGLALQYVPEKLKDYNVCMEAVNQNKKALQYVPTDVENYNEIVIQILKQNGFYVQEGQKDYKKIVLESVKQDGHNLVYVPQELKDYNICMEAVKQKGASLEYVPSELKDYNICMEAVKQDGYLLRYVPQELKEYNMCMEAVKQNGYALQYVPQELKEYNFYLEAVKQNGYALQYVPTELKDYNMCMEAVKQYEASLEYVPQELKEYKEIALEAVKQNGYALKYVPQELKEYKEIALEAVKQNADALKYVPEEIKDYNFYLEAVKNYGLSLKYVPEEIKDFNICMEAVKQNEEALKNVPDTQLKRIKFNYRIICFSSSFVNIINNFVLKKEKISGTVINDEVKHR